MNRKLWRRQLAVIQDWSPVERACIPAVLLVLTYLHYFVWIALLLVWDSSGTLVNPQVLTDAAPMLAFWMVGGALIVMLGLALRRRAPDAEWFMYLSAIFYACSQVWGGQMVGQLSFVVGIVMTGAPLVGFILLSRRVILVASIIALLVIMACNLATAYGHLPYAPFLKAPRDVESALLWTHSQWFLALPHLVFLIVLSSLILGHWRKREAAVLRQSLTDALTGVHNRRSILDLLDSELARSRRQHAPLAVLLLDLDHFKRINDSWGHPAGDRVLQSVANVLKDTVRQCDEVGRFGGEEFLLLLPDTLPEDARTLLERCREALAQTRISSDNGETFSISACFGVAGCHGSADAVALTRSADAALYRAKEKGRNRVEMGELVAG